MAVSGAEGVRARRVHTSHNGFRAAAAFENTRALSQFLITCIHTHAHGRAHAGKLHVWDWKARTLRQTVDLGADGLIPLELRFAHDPSANWAYVVGALYACAFERECACAECCSLGLAVRLPGKSNNLRLFGVGMRGCVLCRRWTWARDGRPEPRFAHDPSANWGFVVGVCLGAEHAVMGERAESEGGLVRRA